MASGQGTPGGGWYISVTGGGQAIAEFDTFIGIRFQSSASLPILPVEEGSFFTANKWSNPFNAIVEMAKWGEVGSLNQMMVALERYKNSTDLVDIVTPYFTFINGNISSIEYEFSTDETGLGMVSPKIGVQEIKLIKKSASSITPVRTIDRAKNAESNNTINVGKQTSTGQESASRKLIGNQIPSRGTTR